MDCTPTQALSNRDALDMQYASSSKIKTLKDNNVLERNSILEDRHVPWPMTNTPGINCIFLGPIFPYTVRGLSPCSECGPAEVMVMIGHRVHGLGY